MRPGLKTSDEPQIYRAFTKPRNSTVPTHPARTRQLYILALATLSLFPRTSADFASPQSVRPIAHRKREEGSPGCGDVLRETMPPHMRYNEYLALGFPIASGPGEGACKNLIKDRMERSGMRWTPSMAEAILKLRNLVPQRRLR